MIKHIIFDFGGVFLDLGGKHTGIPVNLAEIFGITEEKAAEIWTDNKDKLLTGKETPKDFLIRTNSYLKTSINVDKSYEIWKNLNKINKNQVNWDLVSYAESLSKKYQLHMLTDNIDLDNGASEWFYLIAKHFKNIYKSFETGRRKPNKDVFLYVLEKINSKPEECIFVDDLQKNIDSANDIGMKGMLYTNLDQLRKDFTILGVKIDI